MIERLLLFFISLITVASNSYGGEPVAGYPQRVVSINLCTDELAILLSKPGQLVSVTTLVKDPQLSRYWQLAKRYRSHKVSLEQIISLKPNLVLASQYTPKAIRQRLIRLGYRLYILPEAKTISQVKKNIIALGVQLGNKDKADRLVTKIERQLNAFDSVSRVKKNKLLDILIYLPGGTSRSDKGLLNQLVEKAGMRNLAIKKGYSGWHPVSIEQLLRWDPDFLMVIQTESSARSVAKELLTHPAIQYYQKQNRLIAIPTQWISCGNPSMVKTLNRLTRFRERFLLERR